MIPDTTSATDLDPSDTLHKPIARTPERFTLLDLMLIVLAYGIGFGVAALFIPRGAGSFTRLIAGCILGSITIPPLVLMGRALRPSPRPDLSPGDRLALAPVSGLAFLFLVGTLARSSPATLAGFMLWGVTQIGLGLVSGFLLIGFCFNAWVRQRSSWLGVLGYLLNLGMMVLAGLWFWAMSIFLD